MSRLAMLSPPETGHLNPSLGLAQELKRRGHEVIFYQLLDVQQRVESAGFECRAYCRDEYPLGSIKTEHQKLGELSGWRAGLYTIRLGEKRLGLALSELPPLFHNDRLDAIVSDEVMMLGCSLGEMLGIPVVTTSNALMLHMESTVPPPLAPWTYQEGWANRVRNEIANQVVRSVLGRSRRLMNRDRVARGLPRYRTIENIISPLAHVSQIPKSFDFPRQHLPGTIHCTGPFDDGSRRAAIEFPWERLTSRPLIYVSLGTLQNRLRHIFEQIANACSGLPVQVVMSLGGGRDPDELQGLPDNVLAVKYAPQTELLSRARMCVTHAGMNTTLECLAHGVPMVAVPVTNDQPAVAARIEYHGVGKRLSLRTLRQSSLDRAIREVLDSEIFQSNAARFARQMKAKPGNAAAADVIEQVLSTGRPVYRDP